MSRSRRAPHVADPRRFLERALRPAGALAKQRTLCQQLRYLLRAHLRSSRRSRLDSRRSRRRPLRIMSASHLASIYGSEQVRQLPRCWSAALARPLPARALWTMRSGADGLARTKSTARSTSRSVRRCSWPAQTDRARRLPSRRPMLAQAHPTPVQPGMSRLQCLQTDDARRSSCRTCGRTRRTGTTRAWST